jgi:hypothetical protein
VLSGDLTHLSALETLKSDLEIEIQRAEKQRLSKSPPGSFPGGGWGGGGAEEEQLPELVVLTLDQDYQQVAGTESRKTHFQRQLRVDVANAISVDMRQVFLLLLLRIRRERARAREKERERERSSIHRC